MVFRVPKAFVPIPPVPIDRQPREGSLRALIRISLRIAHDDAPEKTADRILVPCGSAVVQRRCKDNQRKDLSEILLGSLAAAPRKLRQPVDAISEFTGLENRRNKRGFNL